MDWHRPIHQLLILAGAAALLLILVEEQKSQRGGRPPAQKRHRRSVQEVYHCLGDNYFRKAYRMSYDSFWVLHSKLENEIKNAVEDRRRQLGGSSEHC
jgi:hypothetical protein